MRIQIEPLCDELQIAADLCEESGEVICSHLLRTIADSILRMTKVERVHDIELVLIYTSWNSFCDFECQDVLKFLRRPRHLKFLKRHGFQFAARVLARLGKPLATCFDSFLFYLLNDQVVSLPQAIDALTFSKNQDIELTESISRLGYATQLQVAEAQSLHLRIEFVDLEKTNIPESVLELCPEAVCREFEILPIRVEGETLIFGSATPFNQDNRARIRYILNREIEFVLVTRQAISETSSRLFVDMTLLEAERILAELEPAPRQPVEKITSNQMSEFRKLWNPVMENIP